MYNITYKNDAYKVFFLVTDHAALVSIKELKLLQEIEDKIDIEDAWKAKNELGEPIPWEELKKELEL